MIIQAKVGPPTSTSSLAQGQVIEPRLGNMGEQISSELHGIYYEATYRRTIFHAAIAAQVTSVGLTATHTGLVLSNPVGVTSQLGCFEGRNGIYRCISCRIGPWIRYRV